MKTVVGLFDTHAHAETAAHDLERAGISHEDISLIASNTAGQFKPRDSAATDATEHVDAGSETGKGAVAGGVAGLLLGLVALAIPGLGAIAAAGWLTTLVAGAVVGAGVGLVGALTGIGIPHEDAAYYAEGVRRGGTLLAARVPEDQAKQVAQILGSDGAVNIAERAEQYRQEGFEPATPTGGAATAVSTDITAPSAQASPTPPLPAQPAAPASKRKSAQAKTGLTTPAPTVAMESKERAGELGSPAVAQTPDVVRHETESGVRVYSHVIERPAEQIAAPPAEPASPERPQADRPARDTGFSRTADDLHPRIEIRAYELYEQRGRGDGLALQDWLTAEREIWTNLADRTTAASASL